MKSASGRRAKFLGLVVAGLLGICLVCPIGSREQQSRTETAGARSDDWLTVNKDYSNQRYVDLDEITPSNVGNLGEVCEIQLNEPALFSSGLLKIGRTLYFSTMQATYAVDAATCDLEWRYPIVFEPTVATNVNRGPGYLNGKIFQGTIDGRVIALNAKTGDSLWQAQGANPANNESFTAAPIAWQGKVFVGIATSDLGIAGRLMAFDANPTTTEGQELWRFQTTPGTPPSLSGGGFWSTAALDPKTHEVFGPVANPFPDWSRFVEFPPPEGDLEITKYTNSVVSVDASTGLLNWSYQLVPGDEHDWDLSAAPTLYRSVAGREMVALTGKSGRVYGIDRATHLLAFNTPATTVENDQEPLNDTYMYVCPGVQGGAMFNGAAYSPMTGALYVGMADHCAWFLSNPQLTGLAGGVAVKDWAAAAKLQAPRGWITSIDGDSGSVLWKYQAESQVLAGLVPTKSGLLFGGDTHGHLLIFRAADGTLLNQINAGGALNNGLISYAVDGEQYVAVAAGGPTENPSTVAGPLRVVVYGLHGSSEPKVVTPERLALTTGLGLYFAVCERCHGLAGAGSSAPPITRQSQLSDPERLKQFLSTVPPPMPHLYPGVLEDSEVALIADYLKTDVFNCGPSEPQSCAAPVAGTTGGTPAWQAIYSDLTSPRCINCHPVASPKLAALYFNPLTNAGYPQDYPRQGDDRHPHYYAVVRGDTAPEDVVPNGAGMGPPYERCTSCHGNQNDPVTGIPGTSNPNGQDPTAPFWALAPASMAWESAPGVPLNGAQLCANLLNKQLNGNRTPDDLLEHIETEPLVAWAFDPGIRPNGEPRTTPPVSKDALIAAFEQWIAEGTPCPASVQPSETGKR